MVREKTFTWVKTNTKPETWDLGIRNGRSLRGLCATVHKLPNGEWAWHRWQTRQTGPAVGASHRAGSAPTRGRAMKAAAGDLVTGVWVNG